MKIFNMYEAGFVNLLKTICFLILIYYVFKFIIKYIFPFFLKKAVTKMHQKAEQFGNKQPNIKEGETIIDKKATRNQQSNKDLGEYIDFEEVE